MFLPLDPSSGLPIYRQIIAQVRRMVAAGLLAPGERLESVRDLAARLQINPLTVAKAYQELEREGVVETRRGLGVFVKAAAPVEARSEARQEAARAAAERLVLEAVQAGLSRKETIELMSDCWRALGIVEAKGAKR